MNAMPSPLALHSAPDAGRLGVSSMASVLSGTIAGLTAMTADGLDHLVHRACNHLNGIGMILEPQIVMVEGLAGRIHAKRDVVPGDYLDPSGEVEAACQRNAAHLRALIAGLTKGEQSVAFDTEIDIHQRQQLHTACQRVIALAQRAIKALESLAGVVVTHDLDAEPPSAQTWDNLEDMLMALKAQAA